MKTLILILLALSIQTVFADKKEIKVYLGSDDLQQMSSSTFKLENPVHLEESFQFRDKISNQEITLTKDLKTVFYWSKEHHFPKTEVKIRVTYPHYIAIENELKNSLPLSIHNKLKKTFCAAEDNWLFSGVIERGKKRNSSIDIDLKTNNFLKELEKEVRPTKAKNFQVKWSYTESDVNRTKGFIELPCD